MPDSASLRAYHQKRNFTRTKEPRGKLRRRTGDLFVVHKHDARRLHYDLRLELDGVLKSWAVTRGPSLSPADKRLGVRTEDHPLDYGEFEGKIPEGEYGAGSVIVWDRGRWSTEGDPHQQLAKGHLEFELDGNKLKGRWHLVHMRGRDKGGKENWLLIKVDDEYATTNGATELLEDQPRSVKTGRTVEDVAGSKVHIKRKPDASSAAKRAEKKSSAKPTAAPPRAEISVKGAKSGALPGFIEPALASLAEKPPVGDRWVHEVKLDGFRVLARLDDGDVSLWSRNGLDVADRFRRVALDLGRGLRTFTCVVDGVVCAVDEAGVPRFQLLQNGKGTLVYYLFDVLEVEGRSYVGRPFDERRAELERIVDERAPTIRLSRAFDDGEALLEQTGAAGLEGIISKRRTAKYAVGRRSNDWQKVKHHATDVFAIAGYLPGQGRRSRLGSLVLAARDGTDLTYVGLVGAGLSEGVIDELLAAIEKRRIEEPKIVVTRRDRRLRRDRVVWCKPTLRCRVEFAEWTNDGRLRSPVYKGLVTRQKVATSPAPDTSAG